jgi:hypothetical protein
LNFEATKVGSEFQKNRYFVVNSGFLDDQFRGITWFPKFLGEAGKFRLVISESKFTRGINQKISTHQK